MSLGFGRRSMSHCPADEMLARLAADALDAVERDALAQHVEECAECRRQLGDLTEIADAEKWRRVQKPPPRSALEDEMLARVKQKPRLSGQPTLGPGESPERRSAQRGRTGSPINEAEAPAVPGFEILGPLGHGGMGVVFKARHVALQRIVALKTLRNWTSVGQKELCRFRAEADVIARLQHPNIVQIYDVGEVSGRPYLVLEYVAGGNLAARLDGTPQSVRVASQLVEVLARAVQVAHANGVVHRDLKPANILLTAAEGDAPEAPDAIRGPRRTVNDRALARAIPKIADFGVARIADGDRDAQPAGRLTVTGDFIGTPSYMAPEQAAPLGPPVGPAADVYALGAIFYELLTGRPPFKGETPLDTVLQVLHNEPVSVMSLQPTVPRDLETICLKCLRKEPHRRYPSASELADDIQRFHHGQPIKARSRGTIERAWRWIRDHPAASGLVAAGAVTPLVALIILSLLSARLVRSSALESAAQQAELLEQATNQYSQIVQRVEQAHYQVNKMVPPTPDTVPLSIPATFLHDVGEELSRDSKTGIQVRQFSNDPFPWRIGGGPRDDFEREALKRLIQSKGQETVHEFTQRNGEPVVRYAQARIMKQSCVECHNSHPLSTRKDWKVGDVRGILEIIRPLKNDEARVSQALELTLTLSALGSGLLLSGSVLAVWTKHRLVQRDW